MENSSISSASEYRPRDFNEMIGQDAIVKTLSNAIDSQKIPQALLFCGPRGVGKTSSARIFAREINNFQEVASRTRLGIPVTRPIFLPATSIKANSVIAGTNPTTPS